MSTIVRFSPDLSAWLVRHLDRGQSPAELVHTMIEQRMEPRVARSIVEAFVTARNAGSAVPTDSVALEDESVDYDHGPSRLPAGAHIHTFDRRVRVVARSEKPTLALLSDVVSAEECEELVALARPRLEPSKVVDPETGKDVVAGHRTSLGMFFRVAETPFIARLDRRVSEAMNQPVEHGEGFQVLHYSSGALSTPHFDFLRPVNAANRASIERSGQRVSTLVVYLTDVASGGETLFPAAGLAISPQRGNGVYFEYANALGQVDPRSLHGANPVLEGEKWVLTKWMRQRRFVPAGDSEPNTPRDASVSDARSPSSMQPRSDTHLRRFGRAERA